MNTTSDKTIKNSFRKSRLPRLLYSYLATEMLAPFFASFLIMNCVFFLVKLIPFLNFVLELNIGISDFIRLFSYLFPSIFLYTIPMSAMLGVTIGFARLSSDSEILALKASGISMWKILPPVVLVTALIALLTSYFSIKLIPLSEISMKQLTYQLLREKVDKGIKPHVFTEALGDVVVYVDKIDPQTGKWKDVWVSDMRGVDVPTITMASSGEMIGRPQDMSVTIILKNGSLHKPSKTNAQIVEFDHYQINIPLRPPQTKKTRVKRRNILTMTELLAEASQTNGDSRERRKMLIEFHKRMVLPTGCLFISLLGLPLGLQARPGRKAIGIQLGLVIFILYYVLFTLGKEMAEKGTVPVPVAMWTPNLFFFMLAVFWIYRVSNEKGLIPGLLTSLLAKLWSRLRLILSKGYRQGLVIFKKESTLKEEKQEIAKPVSGNPKTKIFHLPQCQNYNCHYCTLEFRDTKIAKESGFKPCPFCKHIMDNR